MLVQIQEQGVSEVCLCAGSRNSPFVESLNLWASIAPEKFHIWHFFDERSASFFALGRVKDLRAPVAVITTSGTAVAECLSAAVEATYSGLPVVFLTADRPKSYRRSGAPQSIEQSEILGPYAKAFDIDLLTQSWEVRLAESAPTHINVCFDEPLLVGLSHLESVIRTQTSLSLKSDLNKFKESDGNPKWGVANPSPTLEARHERVEKQILDFCTRSHRPLFVISQIPEFAREQVVSDLRRILEALNAPVWIEEISGLRGHPKLKPWRTAMEPNLEKMGSDGLVRIGGIPTTRLWRDLEGKFKTLPVLAFSHLPFSGLSRESSPVLAYRELPIFPSRVVSHSDLQWRQGDEQSLEKLESLLRGHPNSEPGFIRALSELIPAEDGIYLGNSLPIREWDLFSQTRDLSFARREANRGANGIDGQVSTFLGWSARRKSSSWAILGDLTAAYDLSALWITDQLSHSALRLVIVNNGGGQIFKRMYGKEIYRNSHQKSFLHWAKMFDFHYEEFNEEKELNRKCLDLPRKAIIEIFPDAQATENFWNQWQS